jgi:hypothetical protein
MKAGKTTNNTEQNEKLERMMTEWMEHKHQCAIAISRQSQGAPLMS